MSRLKKILRALALVLVLVLVIFLMVVGPWPSYSDSHFETSRYYAKALADIEAHASDSSITSTPGPLRAGWARRDMTPKVGTPLAGYGARKGGKNSVDVYDLLCVRALALSDGDDTIVLVGSDMLIIPPNIAEMVREEVGKQTGLAPDDILLNASHTHCGPGGFGPGFASKITGGAYDPEIPLFLAKAFSEAIIDAVNALEPAKLASGGVDAPEYIRNRMREGAPVDSELSFLVAEQEDGDRCYLVSYSAHPTTFGASMMEFSAEYPGMLLGAIELDTGADTVYLGGAVGSMGPKAPEADTDAGRVYAMGRALAALVLENSKDLAFETNLDVASVGIELGMPSLQWRPFENRPGWRLSPVLPKLLGVPAGGWIQGVRVGRLLFMGMPCDFSGEISIDWKAWAERHDYDLWNLSFCGTYCGYFSPDKYYLDTPMNYETGLMSWYGPNVEAYFTALFQKVAQVLDVPEPEAS